MGGFMIHTGRHFLQGEQQKPGGVASLNAES
jgi:hypothetical protein